MMPLSWPFTYLCDACLLRQSDSINDEPAVAMGLSGQNLLFMMTGRGLSCLQLSTCGARVPERLYRLKPNSK